MGERAKRAQIAAMRANRFGKVDRASRRIQRADGKYKTADMKKRKEK